MQNLIYYWAKINNNWTIANDPFFEWNVNSTIRKNTIKNIILSSFNLIKQTFLESLNIHDWNLTEYNQLTWISTLNGDDWLKIQSSTWIEALLKLKVSWCTNALCDFVNSLQ